MARFASKDMRHTFSSKIEVAKKSWKERAGKALKSNATKEAVESAADVVEKQVK